ncbi:response regulator [Roseovarius sp. LXJ103]|uniref:response regulator transcription factor n=1 Tax=Roseovarius carneus TaxID=2853164 RepID=UPI000D6107BB|nr:response regulator [Roseovarius carneus]MBZ8117309.1 response regulator [Roseovarius carneus]PWE37393.1 hypothetical protein DD563_13460 [Pelagicola sp. LXJ1103]
MKVLIVESDPELGTLWQRHMERMDMDVRLVGGQAKAIGALQTQVFDIIVLNLVLAQGSALVVADFISYRHPDSPIIFVTNTSFFSDGSIFAHSANARAMVQSDTPPEDLANMVAHYGRPV